jgi:hypothetical protein
MIALFPADDNELCPSQLALDRLFVGEFSGIEQARLSRHVAHCARCRRELANRVDERDAFALDPLLLAKLTKDAPGRTPASATRRWQRTAFAVASLAACAACVWIMLWPAAPTPPKELDRRAVSKGGGVVALFVQRHGELRELGDAAQVYPGDHLQVTIRVPAMRFVAVYSKDGGGTLSRYAPVELPMVQVAPGGDVILPNSTILDDVLGHETLAVFSCQHRQNEQVLRAHVERGQPAGCEVVRYRLDKVPR